MAKISKALAKVIEDGIRHEGKHIVLPADPNMTYEEGAQCLMEKHREENQVVMAHEIVEGNPFDALAAFHETLKLLFGWSTTKPTPGFFGPRPPAMVDIKTGPGKGDKIQVPIGLISAPGLDFSFNVQFQRDGLHLFAECKKYQASKVKEIATAVREYLAEHSIYKNKAFRMPASWDQQPKFESFDHVREGDLVLNRNVADSVVVNLFTPLTKMDKLKAAGIPLKNTVLLDGDYGTGKSMTMSITAKIALEAGWTVIYLENTDNLADALENAKRWQPCLLIAEDLDRVAQQRDERLNTLVNTLSGALSEQNDIMVVLTTNHAEKIERVMLRRVELIRFERPNKESVERLIRQYSRGELSETVTLDRVSVMLEGQIPSIIKSVVELARKVMIAFDKEVLDETSLIGAVHAKGEQIEMLNTKKVEAEPTLDRVIKELIAAAAITGACEAQARLFDIMEGEGNSYSVPLREGVKEERKKIAVVN